MPGQEWDTEIELAVESADVVIVFLSSLSIIKEGYIQRELKYILSIALEKPEGTIFVIPLRLDECKPPRRVRTWQYVDYFPKDQLDAAYVRLLQALQLRLDQKIETGKKKDLNELKDKKLTDLNIKPSPLKPENFTVIPSGTRVTIKTWKGSDIPSSYAFAGEMGTPAVPHFYRPRDANLAVQVNRAFLIDKYAVTCAQFSTFLNELTTAGRIQNTTRNGEHQSLADSHLLVIDALDRWKENDPRQPWMHAAQPFGITYKNGQWAPILDSERLPITLVSWWGARLYSLWVHGEDDADHPQNYACLPTPEQWYRAATWDATTLTHQPYPWGNHWEPQWINFSGYWAGKNIIEKNWQSEWVKNPVVHSQTRPLPVADLTENTSPAGCVQMLGNTWEWTLSGLESRLPIRGGCAFSPMEYCQPTYDAKWAIDMPNEYIGFRCSYSLRRF